MPLKSVRAWLGIDAPDTQESEPLREILDSLDQLPPDRAHFLAAFAYLLGRVAHADLHVSPEETRAMEALVREQGQLEEDQARVVVQLAKASNLLSGGTANLSRGQGVLGAGDVRPEDCAHSMPLCAIRDRRSHFDGRRSGDSPHRERATHRAARSRRTARVTQAATPRHVSRVTPTSDARRPPVPHHLATIPMTRPSRPWVIAGLPPAAYDALTRGLPASRLWSLLLEVAEARAAGRRCGRTRRAMGSRPFCPAGDRRSAEPR